MSKKKKIIFILKIVLTQVLLFNCTRKDKNIITANQLSVYRINEIKPTESGELGWCLASYDNYVIVSELGNNINKSENVYILKRDSNDRWSIVQKFTTNKRGFGSSLGMTDNYIAIGALIDSSNYNYSSGSISIYERGIKDDWRLFQKLQVDSNLRGVYYGKSISMFGNSIAIGCLGKKISALGEVHIYNYTSNKWIKTSTIKCPKEDNTFLFGYKLKLHKKNLVVSSGGFNNCVSLYTLGSNNEWFLSETFRSDTNTGTYGVSIDIDDSFLVIGDEEDGEINKTSKTGAVYVYKKNNNFEWVLWQKLVPKTKNNNTRFGSTICLNDSFLIIGAYGDPVYPNSNSNKTNITTLQDSFANGGSVFIYKLDKSGNWIEDSQIMPNNRKPWDKFGFSISVSKNYLLIGSRLEDYNEIKDAGGLYFTKLN